MQAKISNFAVRNGNAMNQKRSSGNNIDMLNGSLTKSMILFALPIIGSGVLQQSFVAVDVAIVGRFAGKEALAAVGSNAPVINLLLNLFIGIAVGANIVIANYLGQKNNAGAIRSTSTAAFTAIVSGIILLILGLTLSTPILTLMSTPEEILPHASLYLNIYFLGMPFLMIYNYGAAILRSIGDTYRPFYMLIVSGIANCVLNIVLVAGYDMGVAGVAIATVIANFLNAVMMMWLLAHEKGPCHVNWLKPTISRSDLVKMLRIGVPTGLQGMVFSIANIFILSSLNSFGGIAVAGSAAALNYEYYAYFIISAFVQACVAFISCNYGAGNHERCRTIVRRAMLLAISGSLIFNLFVALLGRYSVMIFTDDPQVIGFALQRIYIVLMFQTIACSYEITGGAMRGLGRAMTPTVIVIIGTCVLRLLWIFFVIPVHHSYDLLMSVYPLSWILTGTCMLIAWHHIKNKLLNRVAHN